MTRFAALTIAALGLCTAAWAQNIGSASNVQGLVTVSDGQTLTNLQPGQPIPDGSTIITGSGSSVTLQVRAQGGPCTVNVGPSSQVQVSSASTCAGINGSIVASLAIPQGGAAGFLAANGPALGAAAAGVAGVGLVARTKLSGD